MRNDEMLLSMPEWEFALVAHYGLLSEPHAGTTHKGIYYSEQDIYMAWFTRNPDAEPML